MELPALTTLSGGPLQLESDGTGARWTSTPSAASRGSSLTDNSGLQVTHNGTVLDTKLTSLSGANLTLDGTGTIALAQITSFTGGTLSLSGGTLGLTMLSDIDGSSLLVSGGASMTLPEVTGYNGPTGYTTTLQATGAGSMLVLPMLGSITANAALYSLIQVQALAGGNVELPALIKTGGGPLQLESDGAGSMLDISSLTSFQGGSSLTDSSGLQVTHGGTVLDASLTSLSGANLTLDGTGTIAVAPITSFTGGTLSLDAGTLSLPELSDIDGSSLQVTGGASLTLPVLTSYVGPTGYTATLQATGAGSTLLLSKLASITENSAFYSLTQVQALGGGDVELAALTTLSGGPLQLESDGAGSMLDISTLTSFQGGNSATDSSGLQVTHAGTVLDPNLTTFTNLTITTDPTATFTVPANQTFSFPNSTTTISTGTLLDQGSLSVQGGATLNVKGGLEVNGSGILTTASGSTIDVSGNLLGNTTNAAGFNPLGTVDSRRHRHGQPPQLWRPCRRTWATSRPGSTRTSPTAPSN